MPAFPIKTTRPAEAVPSGCMGYDLRADRLLLHTIQTEEAFEGLLTTGVLVPDPARADPLLGDGYGWLYRQMAARLPTKGDGAVWFWAQIRRQDLVGLCKQSPGAVLLTSRVPRERVLLSQFGDWHSALNRSPLLIVFPGESDEEYCARLERAFEEVDARISGAGVARDAGYRHWPEDLRTELESNWEFILDPGNYGRYESWQATVHCLYEDDVVEAVRLQN
jgi:hypothetical protein